MTRIAYRAPMHGFLLQNCTEQNDQGSSIKRSLYLFACVENIELDLTSRVSLSSTTCTYSLLYCNDDYMNFSCVESLTLIYKDETSSQSMSNNKFNGIYLGKIQYTEVNSSASFFFHSIGSYIFHHFELIFIS